MYKRTKITLLFANIFGRSLKVRPGLPNV